MLKSQAPSRQKVNGRLPSNKRQKATPTLTAAPPGTAGREGRVLGSASPATAVSRSPVPTSSKASIVHREAGRSRSPRGWQNPSFQIKNVNNVAADRNNRATTKVPPAAANRSMERSSAIIAAAAAGPVRRAKVRAQQQPAAAVAIAEIDWRVKPRRDQGAAATSSSGRGRSEARTEAATAERSPAKRSNSNRSSGGGAQSSSGGGGGGKSSTAGSKNSNAGSKTGSTSSPRKKPAAAAAATTTMTTTTTKHKKDDKKGEQKGQGDEEEEEEKLPRCPYPGHKNVSWTCRGCGGAKHHLTSRSAMEPLQRVHGFKVQRVPNDGDCFFSSIKAALPDGAAAGTEAARAGTALTVAEMREWVAKETGEEQLEFYILQAGAHPEDRWLDFVRPLDERIPSDDDEEEDDDDDKDDDSYKDDAESAASLSQSQSQSQSQGSRSKSRTSPRKPASGSQLSRATKTRGRKKEDDGTSEGGGSEGGSRKSGKGKGRRGKRGGGGDEDAGIAATCTGGEDGVDDTVDVAVTAVSISPASGRHARRLRRRRSGGRGPAVADSPAAATKTSKNEKNARPSSSQPPTAAAAGSSSWKSARLGRGRQTEGDWRVGADSGGKGAGTGGAEIGEKGNKGKEDQDEGLPFVQTVEDLRRFVRLEGSVVGHGNCMWADTFAHHVVSRRLKITILFVDMEREKSAWPYRVLARTMTDSGDEDDERFVVLKREPSHFVLLKTAPSPDEKSVAGTGSGGSGGAATATKQRRGQACFSRSDLPDVVRRLWQIEPKVKEPASRVAGGCGRRA